MDTQSTVQINPKSPVLFPVNTKIDHTALADLDVDALTDDDRDVILALQQTAADAGFTFLFEVPAGLFDTEIHCAAVVQSFDENNKSAYLFLLCNLENGLLSLLDLEDAPDSARAFFFSYTNVLASLSKMQTIKKLH